MVHAGTMFRFLVWTAILGGVIGANLFSLNGLHIELKIYLLFDKTAIANMNTEGTNAAAVGDKLKTYLEGVLNKPWKMTDDPGPNFKVTIVGTHLFPSDTYLPSAGVASNLTLELALSDSPNFVASGANMFLMMTDYGISPPVGYKSEYGADKMCSSNIDAVGIVPYTVFSGDPFMFHHAAHYVVGLMLGMKKTTQKSTDNSNQLCQPQNGLMDPTNYDVQRWSSCSWEEYLISINTKLGTDYCALLPVTTKFVVPECMDKDQICGELDANLKCGSKDLYSYVFCHGKCPKSADPIDLCIDYGASDYCAYKMGACSTDNAVEVMCPATCKTCETGKNFLRESAPKPTWPPAYMDIEYMLNYGDPVMGIAPPTKEEIEYVIKNKKQELLESDSPFVQPLKRDNQLLEKHLELAKESRSLSVGVENCARPKEVCRFLSNQCAYSKYLKAACGGWCRN